MEYKEVPIRKEHLVYPFYGLAKYENEVARERANPRKIDGLCVIHSIVASGLLVLALEGWELLTK